eukprot:jgi/Pico_ML_1/55689/g1343.t1
MVRKWGYMIGAVERFSLGFRGPLCIICGYVGVSSLQFFQASPYLAALAIVTGPNAVGHVIGPLLAGLGYSFAQWKAKKKEGKTPMTPKPNIVTAMNTAASLVSVFSPGEYIFK